MKNLNAITGVHNVINDYLSAKDFSRPFVICATNHDREESIDYIIDTLCGSRTGRYQMVKPIDQLRSELTRVKDNGYLVKKFYFKSEADESMSRIAEILGDDLGSDVPVFIIFSNCPPDTEIAGCEKTGLVFRY